MIAAHTVSEVQKRGIYVECFEIYLHAYIVHTHLELRDVIKYC